MQTLHGMGLAWTAAQASRSALAAPAPPALPSLRRAAAGERRRAPARKRYTSALARLVLELCEQMTLLAATILEMEASGQSDEQIAQTLTERGFRSPQRDTLLQSTVKAIRLKHNRIHRFSGPRPRRVSGFLALPQLAKELAVTSHFLYHLIDRGIIQVERDVKTHLYLFPDHPDTLAQLRQICDPHRKPVSPRQGHQDA